MAKRIIEIRKARGGKFQAHLLNAKGKPAWSTPAHEQKAQVSRAAKALKDLLWNDVTFMDVQIIDKTAA